MKHFKRWLLALAGFTVCGLPAMAQEIIMGDVIDKPVGSPQDSAVCNGVLYVADAASGKVRSVNLANGIYTPTVAQGFALPIGMACGNDGKPYLTDAANNGVFRINLDGTVTLVAQMAPGATTRGITRIGTGLVWANWGSNSAQANSIWMMNAAAPEKVAGTGVWNSTGDGGPATSASFRNPYGVAVMADGSVIVSEQNSSRLRRFMLAGNIETIAGDGYIGFLGDGGPANQSRLSNPTLMEADGADLYFIDSGNKRVRRIRAGIITTALDVTSTGVPTGISITADAIYLSFAGLGQVRKYIKPGAPTPAPTNTGAPPTFTQPPATPTPSPSSTRTSVPPTAVPSATASRTVPPTASPSATEEISACETWWKLGSQIGCQ